MTDLELHNFFEDLVRRLRAEGVLCAITSGLACVHYGIAESTKDCDLLCHPASFAKLLELLEQTKVDGGSCRYRGNISPPLDARWHQGGWTSHFCWDASSERVKLDVFGRALREATPWVEDADGLYAGMQVVAWMKRTDRDKDWPFISSLGEQLLLRNDPRGWLHIYDAEVILRCAAKNPVPEAAIVSRPLLKLAAEQGGELRLALKAERELWQELDRLRIQILRRALRPYVVATGRELRNRNLPIVDEHAVRVKVAEEYLDPHPLRSFGLARYLAEARENTERAIHPSLVKWLPSVEKHFNNQG